MLSRIVAAVSPGARFVGSSTFPGGISSHMVLVEIQLDDGTPDRFVVRRARGGRGSISMAVEHRLLQTAWARGLPVPQPLLFDAGTARGGAWWEEPALVLAYVDGAPRCSAVSVETGIEMVRCVADVLASVHAVDGADSALAELPYRTERVGRALDEHRAPFDDVLRSHWPPPTTGHTLLHCDVWLGNVLWSDTGISALIDWETAHVGDPLVDVATFRLECAWSFGREAVTAFTDRYATRTGIDLRALPLWDLVAARRAARDLSSWATDWVNYGRPDMTADVMREARQWFVVDALDELGEL